MWPYLQKQPLTETTVEPFFRFNAFPNVDNAFWKRCQRVLERWQCISTKRNIHWKPFQNRCRTFGMRFETLTTHHNESENPLKTISKSLHERTNSDALISFEKFSPHFDLAEHWNHHQNGFNFRIMVSTRHFTTLQLFWVLRNLPMLSHFA